MLSGDNSILQKATDAKTQTGIGQEKEIVVLAYNSALAKKVGNGDSTTVISSELDDELNSLEASASGSSPIIVEFTNGHKYSIDTNGTVKDYVQVILAKDKLIPFSIIELYFSVFCYLLK